MYTNRPLTDQGFTAIELIVALAIAAIIVSVGVPGFQSVIEGNQSVTISNELLKALAAARNEAIKRGYPVYLCSSIDPEAVNPVCNSTSSTNWDDGWLMMADADNDGDFSDQAENPLMVHSAIRSDFTLIGQSAIKNQIGFEATGFATQQGSVVLCSPKVKNFTADKQNASVIIVNGSGRSRVFKGDSGAVSVTSCTPT